MKDFPIICLVMPPQYVAIMIRWSREPKDARGAIEHYLVSVNCWRGEAADKRSSHSGTEFDDTRYVG
jgi:hypothetical protein